jgi:uncharacterized protein (DUF1778 family)
LTRNEKKTQRRPQIVAETTEEFHARVKSAAALEKMSLADFVNAVLEAYFREASSTLTSVQNPNSPASAADDEDVKTPYPPAHMEPHILLNEILTKGTPKDAEWITGNLLNFVEAIRSRTARPTTQRKAAG